MTGVVVAVEYGGPEVLSWESIELAQPGPGEVTVALRAVGVNPYDYKSYSGTYGADEAKLPLRLGSEGAGVVVAVGPETSNEWGPVRVGDEVIVYPMQGAYAETVTVVADALTPKPATLDFTAAAGLMLAGTTAVHMLAVTEPHVGDTVLIHGASGGVGLLATQIAKARGAHVIGTASLHRHQQLRQYGALPLEYGPGLWERVREVAGDGVDVALDAVGTDEAIDTSLQLIEDRHKIATIAAFGRADTGIRVLGAGPGADPGRDIRRAARGELVALVDEGQLEVTVDRTFALPDAAEAHRYLASGKASGKVILLP